MHQISDGERRRVQLCMGLMTSWDVLLLDEVTVDLDVLVRADLLEFLIEESETRGATIVYATHIFDGLHTFPTHICHLQLGKTPSDLLPWPLPSSSTKPLDETKKNDEVGKLVSAIEVPDGRYSDLLKVVLGWLREDRDLRREKEKAKGRMRGARKEVRYCTKRR
jgi:CCR4-NOT complex subunit CAF16